MTDHSHPFGGAYADRPPAGVRIGRRHGSAEATRTMIAAMPFAICLLIPLVQIGGVIYVYDVAILLALLVLGMPVSRSLRAQSRPFMLLGAGIAISLISSFFWAGITLRAVQQTGQCLLGLAYAWSVFANISCGRVSARGMAGIVAAAAAALAMLFIAQAIGFRTMPQQTAEAYRTYLTFAGFEADFFDRRYLAGVAASGTARVMGSWDVSTTAAGMLALATLWVLASGWRLQWQAVLLLVTGAALVATGSRHAWVLWILIGYAVLRSAHLTRSLTWLAGVSGLILFGAAILTFGDVAGIGQELFGERMQRTLQSGFDDSSIQARYVEGSWRFLEGMLINPHIALFGFGISTEKELWTALGPYGFYEAAEQSARWAFVSNGWLLSIRNFGILAFAGLVMLVAQVRRTTAFMTAAPSLFFVLIILADNYPMQVPRCFMLIVTSAAFFIAMGRDRAMRRAGMFRREP